MTERHARLMKLACVAIAVCCPGSGGSVAAEGAGAACPIRGEVIQWVADLCMARLGTDDEIAASDCIALESKREFKDDCAAKTHFKRALCKVVVSSGVWTGSAESCVDAPSFEGATVRNGGVGS